MTKTKRFDVEIVGQKNVAEPSNETGEVGTPPFTDNHWLVRIVNHHDEGIPFAVGSELLLSKNLFNAGSFLGDTVSMSWNGKNVEGGNTLRHAFHVGYAPLTAPLALVALRNLHGQMMDSHGEFPLAEVAGRSKYAGRLLEAVLQTNPLDGPCGPVTPKVIEHRVEAVRLTADIFLRLKISNIWRASKPGCSHAVGCELLCHIADSLSRQAPEAMLRQAARTVSSYIHTWSTPE